MKLAIIATLVASASAFSIKVPAVSSNAASFSVDWMKITH